PRWGGSMPTADLSVGTALVGAPGCGYVTKLQIKVTANGTISDARFKTYGSGYPRQSRQAPGPLKESCLELVLGPDRVH
ncbi:hypothetical protein B0H11DRAFT_1703017, partial [Mycena galericulata]